MKLINRLIPLLFIAILPVASCVIEGQVDFVLTTPYTETFPINEPDGVWDESITITYSDVMDELDISDANIVRVDIEAIGFTTTGAPAALQGVKDVTLTINSPSFPGGPYDIILNETIEKGSGKDTVFVTSLVEEGVLALKDKFEGFVFGSDQQSFTLRTTGRSNPDGTPLTMDLNAIIKLGVVTVEEL